MTKHTHVGKRRNEGEYPHPPRIPWKKATYPPCTKKFFYCAHINLFSDFMRKDPPFLKIFLKFLFLLRGHITCFLLFLSRRVYIPGSGRGASPLRILARFALILAFSCGGAEDSGEARSKASAE